MARPMRYELPGALYHLTSKSCDAVLFKGDQDRLGWIGILRSVMSRYRWRCLAWCQLEQHYHLVVSPLTGLLTQGMSQLNGRYTRFFNHRHQRKGKLFAGRFQALLVDEDRFLLPLVHEVLTEPQRLGLVDSPHSWPWSSAAALLGQGDSVVPLDLEPLHRHPAVTAAPQEFWPLYLSQAQEQRLWDRVRHQLFLGDRQFVQRMQQRLPDMQSPDSRPSLQSFRQRWDYQEGMARAYLEGHYTLQQIAAFYQVHPSTVSRQVAAYEARHGLKDDHH
ncbi:transposase [Marinospirillum alkaliphilum]|uniref:REP element-mobilizing transposase RayT n=1 Tax=Marinospirillum alkaliphilum DSM 21637 TaxID=1122209 RepID=A0A1K1UAB0_9GAMM|nr:transposase [Marinospirillum alkaliphilum]SFX09548.1 REP element-mobilizing transposase RayT [Marinospirillum alkaliphilum DSM 21637]